MTVKVLNPDERIFESWGTAEVVDKDGQVLPINEFEYIMPVMMDRGGEIMYSHSNKKVGKILNYQFKDKTLDDGTTAPGLLITGKIYNNYDFDTQVWDAIKSGKITGLSFGGRQAQMNVQYSVIQGQPAEILRNLEGFEFSVVENPANQEATMTFVNNLAKSEKKDTALFKYQEVLNEIIKMEVQKPFGGYSNFEDCVSQNSDKENASVYCASIMHTVEGKSTQKQTGDNMADTAPVETVKSDAQPINVEELNKKFEDSNKRFETLEKGIVTLTESLSTLTKSMEEMNKNVSVAKESKEDIVKSVTEEIKKGFTVGTPTPRPENPDLTKRHEKKENIALQIALGQKKFDMQDVRKSQEDALDNTIADILAE